MALVIPLQPELLRYDVDVTISGVPLVITVTWRERVESWYLDIALPDETMIVRNRRVTTGWAPLLRTVDDRLPAGELMNVRVGDSDADPMLTEYGDSVLLMFMTRGEIDALEVQQNPNPPRKVVIS